MWLGRFPFAQPILECAPGDVQIDGTFLDVEADDVPFLYRRDRAAHSRFGRNVTDTESSGSTAETAIRD